MRVTQHLGPAAVGGQDFYSPATTEACTGSPLTLANAITVGGYALGLWWAVGGGPPAAALWSIIADDLDGMVARSTGSASCLGGTLDWACDIVLTGLVAHRLGLLPILPLVTATQVYLRTKRVRPPPLSLRAVGMIAALIKEHSL